MGAGSSLQPNGYQKSFPCGGSGAGRASGFEATLYDFRHEYDHFSSWILDLHLSPFVSLYLLINLKLYSSHLVTIIRMAELGKVSTPADPIVKGTLASCKLADEYGECKSNITTAATLTLLLRSASPAIFSLAGD
jgi:hypothetical protein